MPSACGPQACDDLEHVPPAELRLTAHQLQRGYHALAQEAEHGRAAGPGCEARLADSLEEGELHFLARRIALLGHGLGKRDQLRQAVGKRLGPELDLASGAKFVQGQNAHHQGGVPAPEFLRLELQRLHSAAGQFLLHRREVWQARPIQPVAGDLDEKNRVLFPPSGSGVREYVRDYSFFTVGFIRPAP